MIAPHRVRAYMLRHLYEVAATFDRKFDIIFWPIIDLLVFGFLTVYIQKFNVGSSIAGAIIGGLLLWSVIYSVQRDISVSILEDAWSRNLYNLLSTPLKVSEIIIGVLSLSILKAFITITVTISIAAGLFHFDIFSVGPILVFYFLNIFVFGWGFGCLTASLIFRFGTRVQIFAWSLIALIFPISGVFYPLSTLPHFWSTIAHLLPISYIFEGIRTLLIFGQIPPEGDYLIISVLNLLYLLAGIWTFKRGFAHAKGRGWFIHPS